VLFSSHILSDVELLCDRVAIVDRGQLVAAGPLSQLLRPDVRHVEIEVAGVEPDAQLTGLAHAISRIGSSIRIVVAGESGVEPVLRHILGRGGQVVSVTPRRETLEDLFVRRAVGGG
jgi:ABC-2 type transport system ATP-binding protein